MKISSFHLKTQKTARVFKMMKYATSPRVIWIALHGYGQLPEYFIKKFVPLADDDHAVICPEGLSRFYLEGTAGRVGASWMTKEDRLLEIDDYSIYLNALLTTLTIEHPDARIVVLGFSQGGATAVRWMMQKQAHVHALVLWSAHFPEDLVYADKWPFPESFPVFAVRGDRDPYAKHNAQSIPGQPAVTTLTFNGGHTLDRIALIALKEKISCIFNLNTPL